MKKKLFVGRHYTRVAIVRYPDIENADIDQKELNKVRMEAKKLLRKELNVQDDDYVGEEVYNFPFDLGTARNIGLMLEFKLYGKYIEKYKELAGGK